MQHPILVKIIFFYIYSKILTANAKLGMEWMIYLGTAIAFLGVALTTTSRSLVTKVPMYIYFRNNISLHTIFNYLCVYILQCVGPFEIGKIFSVMAIFQSAVPIFASPFFGYFYKATVGMYDTFLFILFIKQYRFINCNSKFQKLFLVHICISLPEFI